MYKVGFSFKLPRGIINFDSMVIFGFFLIFRTTKTMTKNAMAIEIKSNVATPMIWTFFLEVELIGVGEVEGEYEVVVVDFDEVVVVDIDEV